MTSKKDLKTMNSDSALVMSIGTGDKKAFERLVEKHKKTAYRVALGLVGFGWLAQTCLGRIVPDNNLLHIL